MEFETKITRMIFYKPQIKCTGYNVGYCKSLMNRNIVQCFKNKLQTLQTNKTIKEIEQLHTHTHT